MGSLQEVLDLLHDLNDLLPPIRLDNFIGIDLPSLGDVKKSLEGRILAAGVFIIAAIRELSSFPLRVVFSAF